MLCIECNTDYYRANWNWNLRKKKKFQQKRVMNGCFDTSHLIVGILVFFLATQHQFHMIYYFVRVNSRFFKILVKITFLFYSCRFLMNIFRRNLFVNLVLYFFFSCISFSNEWKEALGVNEFFSSKNYNNNNNTYIHRSNKERKKLFKSNSFHVSMFRNIYIWTWKYKCINNLINLK